MGQISPAVEDYRLGAGLAFDTNYAGNSAADGWNTQDINFNGFRNSGNLARAIDEDDYLSVIVETSGIGMTITDVSFDLWRNGSGAAPDYAIQASVDGGPFVSILSDRSVSNSGYDNAAKWPSRLAHITATGLSLSATTGQDVEFRLYGWDGAGNSHVTGGVVQGSMITTSVVPEPTTFLIWALGLIFLAWCGSRWRKP